MKRTSLLILFQLLLLVSLALGQESLLDQIGERGFLRVGTPGDYHPFSVLEDEKYTGFDVELAKLIASELQVELRIQPTTWKDMVSELRDERFDLVVGGVTRTLDRQKLVGFSIPTLVIGKCPLVRREDRARFQRRSAIDSPEVRIAVNPGGTNESYVRANFKKAKVIVVNDNLSIPSLVAEGKADVMVTDNVEAVLAAEKDKRLAALSAENPWTHETLALMAPRDDQAFLNWLNLFLYQAEADGRLPELRKKFGIELRSDKRVESLHSFNMARPVFKSSIEPWFVN